MSDTKIPLPRPPSIPTNIDGPTQMYLRTLTEWVAKQLGGRIPDGTARGAILLASPGGKVYTVEVSDTGTLTTTLVLG